jgi:major membrane immunogen (membrane-anchored lipoprotein)
MRRTRALTLAVVALTAALSLTACGDDDSNGDAGGPADSETSTSAGPTESQPTAPTESDDTEPQPTDDPNDDPEDDVVEVHVTIADGKITPLGETVEADPGQKIRLVVDSDAHDEFHVHSEPEHEFAIEEGNNQEFTFTIDDPAVYEMESHELGVVIVKFQIDE